jgi:eukaryotic-like serine/threonine-protein kinase
VQGERPLKIPVAHVDFDQVAALALRMPAEERRDFLEAVFVTDIQARAKVEARVRDTLQQTRVPDAVVPAEERSQRYRILEVLGRGGMGTVYLAERSDGEFIQRVALKTLNSDVDQESAFLARFAAERQILANLSHPNIARLLDGGRDDRGVPYLVMEYVDGGKSIDGYCRHHGLDTRARVRLFLKVLSAVQSAHHALVVHRDIKPANILVTPQGEPKLLDFGVAKLLGGGPSAAHLVQTQAGLVPMTLRFASPEQVLDQPITVAVDIYALGVVLYELLAGTAPYPASHMSAARLAVAIASMDPLPPSAAARQSGQPGPARVLRGDLDAILLKVLRKRPQERYTSVQRLSDDLSRWLDGRPVEARQGNLAYQLRRQLRRHWLPVMAAGAVLLALSVIAWTWRAERDSAAATANLLTELITTIDPAVSTGFALSARELIDQGAERISIDAGIPALVRERLLSTLGKAYLNLGEPGRAAPFVEQSWREHGDAESAIDLARLRIKQARYPDALELLRPLPARALSAAQARRVQSLVIESDFAMGRMEDGKRALLGLMEALQNDTLLSATEHARAWIQASELAQHTRDIALCRDAVAQAERATLELASADPMLLTGVRRVQATCENNGGDLRRATALGEEALQRVREQFGPAHPRVAVALLALSEPLVLLEEFQRAAAMMDEAEAILRASSNTQSETYANVLLESARISRNSGDPARARQISSEAIALLRSLPNVRPDNLARALNGHALQLADLKHFDEAAAHYEAALAIMQPLGLPSEAFLYANLGRLYCDDLKQPGLGAERLQMAIRIIHDRQMDNGWFAANTESNLGVCHAMAGDFAAAEPLLRGSIEQLTSALGAENVRTSNARRRYANFIAARKRGESRPDVQVYD